MKSSVFSSLRSLALLSVPVLSLPSIAFAAGCCEGNGAFGLDEDWSGPKSGAGPKVVSFSNASFESSRELFSALNTDFAQRWLAKTGYVLTVKESHGSSDAQEKAILQGADPDLVSLDNPGSLDELAAKGQLLPSDWNTRLPESSVPYTTTIVFLVEKGNPKQIHDWADLSREGLAVITSDPKTSSRGRWNYLALWAEALQAKAGDKNQALQQVAKVYAKVPVLNSSARGSAESFVKQGKGDVLLVFESEAKLLAQQASGRKLEVVTPPSSLLVQLPVAYIDRNIKKHEVPRVTISFAKYLFSTDAQEIIAAHGYRPVDTKVLARHQKDFPALKLRTLAEVEGSWQVAEQHHFAANGTYEQILKGETQVAASTNAEANPNEISTQKSAFVPIHGQIVEVLLSENSLVVKHDEIPGVMKAMTMSFRVENEDLSRFHKGQEIKGTLVERKDEQFLQQIEIIPSASGS